MRDRVVEGRLVEVAAPGASGMERRAFGEFESHRGELASYAVGWTTGAEPRLGRLTIGIGAGNPGGGSFHAEVGWHDGQHGFRLVDEPFEDVPEGGPDLTAEAARAHADLPWVWAAADRIMRLDRRALWMLHWVQGTVAIATAQVFARQEPILLVVNDDDDELWQLIGTSDGGPDGKLGHLHHAVDEDPTLIDVLDLQPGEEAVRRGIGAPWSRRRA